MRSTHRTAKPRASLRGEEVTDRAEMDGQAGVRGVRFIFSSGWSIFTPRDVLMRIAARVHKLGWHIVVISKCRICPSLRISHLAAHSPSSSITWAPDCKKGVR